MAKRKKKGKRTKQQKQLLGISKDSLKMHLFKRENYILLGILIFAFILRLIYLFEMSKNDPSFYQPVQGTDQLMYDTAAMEILNGRFSHGPFGYNPLYYYFLALSYYFFGHDLFMVRLVQTLLGVVTCLLCYLIGKKIFNKEIVGLIGAGLCALSGTLIFYEGILLSTSLTTFLCTSTIYFLIQAKNKGKKIYFIFAGLCSGLSSLAQPNAILFVPFILLWMLAIFKTSKKKILGNYCIVLLTTFIIISPVTVRNYITTGKFILLTTAGKFQFWVGNNEYAKGWYDLSSPHLSSIQNKINEEGKSLYIADVVNFIKTKPLKYTKLLFKKFLLFWSSWDIPHQVNYEESQELSFLLRLPLILSYSFIVILGLVGIILSLRQWENTFLLILFITVYMFSVVIILVVGRYRPPVLPPLAIFGAFTIYYWINRFKLKKYKPIFLSIPLIIIATLLVYSLSIAGIIHTIKYPNGCYTETEMGLVIADNSNMIRKSIILDSPSKLLKKELIIDKNISDFKAMHFFMGFYCGWEGKLNIWINGKKVREVFLNYLYRGLRGNIGDVELGLPNPNIVLKKGLNTIVLQAVDNGRIGIISSAFYNYGRSMFSTDGGKSWKKVNGEYMIKLRLEPI